MDTLSNEIMMVLVAVLVTFAMFFVKGWFQKTDKRLEDLVERIDKSIQRCHERIDEIERSQIETRVRCEMRHPSSRGGGTTVRKPSSPDGGV